MINTHWKQLKIYRFRPQSTVWNPVHTGIPPFYAGGALFRTSECFNPQDTAGVYAQDQIKLPYNFFVLAGARYQYIRQNGGLLGEPAFAINSVISIMRTRKRL